MANTMTDDFRLSTLEVVCNVIGATEATVVEKAVAYLERLHRTEQELRECQSTLRLIARGTRDEVARDAARKALGEDI